MTADAALQIWSYVSDFEFMDVEPTDQTFTFYGKADDGSDKIEKIHISTLEILSRDILPWVEW